MRGYWIQVIPVSATNHGIRVAVVNDCTLIVQGVARLLSGYPGRIVVVEVAVAEPVRTGTVDVVLYDAYAGTDEVADLVPRLRRESGARVVMYSWHIDPRLVLDAIHHGAAGYLSKEMSADELVAGIEAIHAGHMVTALTEPARGPAALGDWPGREAGLSTRESEVLALIAAGLSNDQVAAAMYLSVNSVKTYIRTAYRKIKCVRRSQAVIWALQNGFTTYGSAPPNLSLTASQLKGGRASTRDASTEAGT